MGKWFAHFFSLFVSFLPGFAHAEGTGSWTNVAGGATTVLGVGRVLYSVGYASVGYDHFSSEVWVEWHDDGARQQSIYDGIYDKPPARVWAKNGQLCLAMKACPRYEDVCTTHVLAYRYDTTAKQFDEIEDSTTCAE